MGKTQLWMKNRRNFPHLHRESRRMRGQKVEIIQEEERVINELLTKCE